jgi:hypothetical protein
MEYNLYSGSLPSHFDVMYATAGMSERYENINSAVINEVVKQYITSLKIATDVAFEALAAENNPKKRAAITRRIARLKVGNLRPRKLWGSHAAQLWVPITAWGVKRTKAGVKYNGKLFRLFNRDYLEQKVAVDGQQELRNEAYTSVMCSACGALTGPAGVSRLA